jgi:AcrR family transcriptional regulator
MRLTLSTWETEIVPSSKVNRESYHHGDLANALTQAAIDLATTGGPQAVVLREAARQVGVSATAAYRYFESRSELIHAVKEQAIRELAARMEQELERGQPLDDPVQEAVRRLRALGGGYINFALEKPGLFRTAFYHADMTELVDEKEAAIDPLSTEPFQMLVETLDSLVGYGVLGPDRRPLLEVAAWAIVHGVADLILNGPLRRQPPELQQAAIERALNLVVEAIGA